MKVVKEKKQISMNIGVGSIVKENIIDMRYNKREVIITSMSKYLAVCVQDAVGKKKLLVIFEYCKKKEISASSMSYLCEKEEVGQEVDDIIYDIHKREQVGLLTINEDTVFE